MLFHITSKYIYSWLQSQSAVKEESITDWLLFNISQQTDMVYYKTFTRNEEAFNGSDWEWWIIADGNFGIKAYRFLVQAKKIKSKADNYPLLSYSNRNGMQIDLLIKSAENKNAMPLYAYYSCCKPDINNQITNIDYISEDLLKWCQDCLNGCFLASAFAVKNYVFNKPKRIIYDNKLIDRSFGLSLLDSLFISENKSVCKICENLNEHFIHSYKLNNNTENDRGIIYPLKDIPSYVKVLIERRDNLDWYENEFHSDIKNLSGVAIIDARENCD